MTNPAELSLFVRLVEALERIAPPLPSSGLEVDAPGYVWRPDANRLDAVNRIERVDLSLLRTIDAQRTTLLDNTRAFAEGKPANNALLWGARGTGKSSLVKAVHAEVRREAESGGLCLALVEVQRDDVGTLARLLALLALEPHRRFIIFCDDLSFDAGEADYKSLKAVLDGGIAGRPANVIVYATSNRRHLLAREMIENERANAIHASEATEEKVSLSDRFGLSLGFHNVDQEGYLTIVHSYAAAIGIKVDSTELERRALQWSKERGSRSGRTARQFIQHLQAGG
jgi:predicted AAA+ superfamily ATPase